MKDILKKLTMLQKVLVQYYEIEKKIEALPKELADSEEMLSLKREQYAKSLQRLEDLKQRVVSLEEDYVEAKNARAELEKKSSSNLSQREFETHQQDLKEAKNTENHYYNLKEETKRKVVAEEQNVEESKETLQALEESVDEDRKKINSDIAALIKERDQIKVKKDKYSEGIDPTLLFKFERIVKSKNGGSVAVKGRVCQGCHMELPVQFVNTVRKGDEIKFCPYCSRVLYYQEGDDSDIEAIKRDDLVIDDSDDIEIVEDDMDILSSDDDDNGDSESSGGGDVIASEDEFDF